jgi:hypothetical protein
LSLSSSLRLQDENASIANRNKITDFVFILVWFK